MRNYTLRPYQLHYLRQQSFYEVPSARHCSAWQQCADSSDQIADRERLAQAAIDIGPTGLGIKFDIGGALAFGGYACLSHLALRLVLSYNDSLPCA